MPPPVRAAVEALHQAHLAIEPGDQPVGAAGRPGLVNAHGLDPAALQRLEEAGARRQRRRDPLLAGNLPQHVLAIAPLAQHHLDQPIARGEQRQPGTAARRRREPRRIGRQVGQDRLWRAAGQRDLDQAVAPALGHHDPPAGPVDQQPVGKGEIARQAGLLPAFQIDPPKRSAGIPLHQVGCPIARPAGRRAVADQQSRLVGEFHRGRTEAALASHELPGSDIAALDDHPAIIEPHRPPPAG